MSQTLAYIRASTDKQDANNQRHEILEYANNHKTSIDGVWSPTGRKRTLREIRSFSCLLT